MKDEVFSQSDGQVFMQVLNLKNVRPQPLPNKDKKVKVNNQSQIENVQPEQQPTDEQMLKLTTSSNTCINTNVVCRVTRVKFNFN